MNWDDAFEKVIGHEGGYVNNPNDPGGETKYGISKRSYPDEDIAGMTLTRAKEIYKRDYWDKCRCDELPHPVDFYTFDAAVNSGCTRSIKWLQMAIPGCQVDGLIGPQTLRHLNVFNSWFIGARQIGHRLEWMTHLPTWEHFNKGWSRRLAGNLKLL